MSVQRSSFQMAAKYLTSRAFFATSGTLLLLFLLLGLGFTKTSSSTFRLSPARTSCPRYPISLAPQETLEVHDTFQHASNETLGVSDILQHASNATLGVSMTAAFIHRLASGRLKLILSQFQKIFVINLRSRYDHRDSMSLAAALTGLQIEYIDGVTDVDTAYLPPSGGKTKVPGKGSIGAWRAHMNVLRRYVIALYLYSYGLQVYLTYKS